MSIPNPGFPRPGVQYDFQNESQFRAAVQAVISALDAEIQGDPEGIADHDITSAVHTASGLTTGHVLQATGATTFGWQPLDFTDLGGSIADAQVPASAVTQHVGSIDHDALLNFVAQEHIRWDLTGVEDIHPDRVGASAVTQHQAALTILETQITDGSLLARVADTETISGAWTITGLLKLSGSAISATTTTPIQRVMMWDSSAANLEYVNSAPLSNGETFIFAYKSTAGGYQWMNVDSANFPWADVTVAETVSGAWTFSGTVHFTGVVDFITSYATASGYNYPFYSEATQTVASTQGTVGGAFYAPATHTSGTVLAMLGLEAYVAAQGAGGTVTHAYGIYVWGGSENATSVITNFYGLYLETPDVTGTITNKYGLYANNYGTTGYPIYTNQGIVSIGDRLALRDNTQYPVDSVLYKTSGGTIAGSGAAATGDLLFNIDGSAWTSLAIGTEGQVLKSVGGIPTWSANNASDADTLDGQHGAYYLALANATGTLALTKLTLIPEGAVLVGTAGGNSTAALDASWIGAGTFPGAAYTFTTNLTVGGKLTVDNDIFLSNGSNGAIKYDGTLVEFVPTSGDGQIAGGWARGLEWNGGGASVNAAQIGTLGSGDSISYLYFSVNAVSGTSDYNADDTMRWYPNGILYMGGAQPEIRFYETDAGANEKYWRLYAANGVFALTSANDSLGGTDTIFSVTRTGTGQTPDYTSWYIHDWRLNSDGNDAQYFRFYSNSTTGTTNLEMRRSSDSAMKWEIEAPSSGDFYLYNWNFQVSAQDTWIWGDASSGELTFDGQRITIVPQIRATATYDNGTIASGGTLNVNWDNGNSQRCAANLGNITISVNQATAYQGTSYTMEVTNIHGTTGRTVSWSGVSQWVGSAPTATVDAGKMTVVQLYVARNRAGTNYIIGSVILDNVTVPT